MIKIRSDHIALQIGYTHSLNSLITHLLYLIRKKYFVGEFVKCCYFYLCMVYFGTARRLCGASTGRQSETFIFRRGWVYLKDPCNFYKFLPCRSAFKLRRTEHSVRCYKYRGILVVRLAACHPILCCRATYADDIRAGWGFFLQRARDCRFRRGRLFLSSRHITLEQKCMGYVWRN